MVFILTCFFLTNTDLEEDVFEISPHEPLTFWIQSREQKFLIMTEKNLQVCNLDVLERKQSGNIL